VIGLLLASGNQQPTYDPNSVSPGIVGFLATFALVVVSILLFVNMARRVRRLQYREEQEERRREHELAHDHEGGDVGGDEARGSQAPPEEPRQ
jgi:flagellar biosynthesis/type III secretory pathway M-ring protein FliF/YscJ